MSERDASRSETGVSIVVPAYNEQEAIGHVLDELREAMQRVSLPWEVVVVDDGSDDDTAQISRDREARVVQHATNRGYGAALKTGIRHSRYDRVVITDGDGTYPAQEIPALIENLADYDMVVGARAGLSVHMPLLRRPAKWALGSLANYLAGMRIPDLNSGLRAMRKSAVMDFFSLLPAGFSFTTTLTLAMLVNNYEVLYIPINYRPRVGHSKISPFRDTLNFLTLIVRTVLFFAPLRILAPIGGVLFAFGGLKLLYDFWVYDFHVATSTIVILMTALQITVLAFVADLVVTQRG